MVLRAVQMKNSFTHTRKTHPNQFQIEDRVIGSMYWRIEEISEENKKVESKLEK